MLEFLGIEREILEQRERERRHMFAEEEASLANDQKMCNGSNQ